MEFKKTRKKNAQQETNPIISCKQNQEIQLGIFNYKREWNRTKIPPPPREKKRIHHVLYL
jgi:hypothetical protein